MSASRFLRNVNSSPYANSFANVAKKTTTDVVDALVNKRHALENDDFSGSYLARSSLYSDYGTDMPTFGLEELPYDVPELYPGEDEDGGVFGSAAAAPAPAATAPAPAPSVNSLAAGRFDTELFDFGGPLASFRSQQQQLLRTPRGSDASITDGLLRSPRNSDASNISTAEETFAPPVKVKREDARMSSSDAAMKKSRTGKTTSTVPVAPAAATAAPKPLQQLSTRPLRVENAAEDEDMEEENVYQAELASASARGDAALIRQIKNGREKTRRARMCTKFEELHAILNVSNEMMARYTGVGLPAAEKADVTNASGAYEKKAKFKKAQVLNAAVKTIEGMQQTFLDMQTRIDALQRQNEALQQQRRFTQSI
jgi:hypothetical protein